MAGWAAIRDAVLLLAVALPSAFYIIASFAAETIFRWSLSERLWFSPTPVSILEADPRPRSRDV